MHMLGSYGVREIKAEGQMVVNFCKKDGNGCSEHILQEEGRTSG